MTVVNALMYGMYGFIISAVFVIAWVLFITMLGTLMRAFGGPEYEEDKDDDE